MMYEYLLIVMSSGDSSWSSDTKNLRLKTLDIFFSLPEGNISLFYFTDIKDCLKP